ncbi:outer membrane beta-barrel protein [Chelativorans sp.]|uniref:outer membrane beta-barrel protein n=1 Tax=Chelativorans sp. TaxID=2203393 RepID=UPI002811CFB6|nr:outer membrane beta-barrel protein [Chelativorans sp.]
MPYLAGAVCALVAALPAAAQDALRGPLGTSRLSAQAEDAEPATGIPSGTYQPASPGALPDDDAGDTLFPDPDLSSDPFSPLDPDVPGNPPTTATDREQERREAADPAPPEQPEETEDEEVLEEAIPGRARSAAEEEALEFPSRLNEREVAIEGEEFLREENPYEPLGLRVGTFVVVPTLEQGLTWTSNADSSPEGGEAVLSETNLRLNAVSDWTRHQATINAFGTFRKSLSGEEVEEAEGGADADLEIDITHSLIGRAALSYSFGREGASSPVSIAGVEDQPLRHTINASAGLEKALGPLRLRATGEISRNQYGDAELIGGGTLSQSDRNSTLALLRLRGGYELSPALMPFLEMEAGRRFYDEERDSAGFARSSLRLGARAGVALDLSEKLNGEVSVGWLGEDFEDDRLRTISGLALAASLSWSPMRGTIVSLNANTTVEGTTSAGESGSLLHAGTLRIERQMRSNLTGSLALGASYRDYASGGHDLILSGEAAVTWWLNRYAGLTGRARHERQTSSLPGRDYDATSFFAGVTLQR